MKLTIISHTEHYINSQGQVVGWGPTVREINHLLETFKDIWHVAVLHKGEAPASAIPYASGNIHFVPLKPFGGPGPGDKLGVLLQAPAVIRTVKEAIEKADVWQFRAPTGIGVFLIPWLTFFARKPGWYKYAGNWMQPQAPAGYRWQRFWLMHLQRRKVTINGRWPGQPAHCLSFENPCLELEERHTGAAAIRQKDYTGSLNLCFVGRLESAKGIDRLLEALAALTDKSRVASLHVVGDGPLRSLCEQKARELPFEVRLYGFQSREALGHILAACHMVILPSQSEGFPKAIAEGANYGCVPVVSDVSSIGQYILDGANGFLLAPERLEAGLLGEDLRAVFANTDLKALAGVAYKMAGDFTFERYRERILGEILVRSLEGFKIEDKKIRS